ncbi:peptide chain release factor N(5)-glutamine methyltransferase [Vagococcus sp.]|uniref:peptide chain release factor N(5)-glutamine methyltransferase n=1 Tax=Vagococcus sp. TaxID=1933889 RepID=UPI003F9A9467
MDNSMTYFEVLQWASSFLEKAKKEVYIAEYLILERLNWNKTDLLMHFKQEMPEVEKSQLMADLNLILEDVPPQYIIGSTEFLGERYKVSRETLIPRPETEELVMLCLEENNLPMQSVIDIGTGTGIIAISLKKARPDWQVSALDLSEGALAIAQENAKNHQVELELYQSDVFDEVEKTKKFDIIISNPPYIAMDEKDVMDESVKRYEPLTALFAEEQGLAVYKKIARQAQDYLSIKGQIYLEIGYQQGREVQAIFQAAFPKKKVSIVKDMNQNERMIKVTEKED